MENYELKLSDEELSYIIGRIISTKADDEPDFSSKEEFLKEGFHPRAFSWLPLDIEFILNNAGLIDGSDKSIVEFQKGLASEIEKSGLKKGPLQKDDYISLAKTANWCDYRFFRKAVLCRLFKHSFSLLSSTSNDNSENCLKYPDWLPGKWIRKVIPSAFSSF